MRGRQIPDGFRSLELLKLLFLFVNVDLQYSDHHGSLRKNPWILVSLFHRQTVLLQ